MQLKDKNRNERIEHKRRLEKHKKAIESDVSNSNISTKEKTAKENGAIKKKTVKKKIVDKKALKEKQKAISEKIMEDARIGYSDIEDKEEPEESRVAITKEERAERFKRLHAMVQDMMMKGNE